MEQRIKQLKIQNDSVGGIIRCVCLRVPPGLGDPCFDKLEADLAKAMLSIPATKGFAIGRGFESVYMTGSQHNDTFLFDQNACSSPHLILWLGKDHQSASKKFWEQLSSIAKSKYKLEASSNIDKIMKLHEDSAKLQNIKNIYKMNNYIYRVQLKKLSENLHKLRGKWGYFYEYYLKNLNIITKFINTNFQTITYYGVKKSDMVDFAKNNNYKSVILYSNTVLKNSIHLYNKFGFKKIDNPDAPYERSDIKMEYILSNS